MRLGEELSAVGRDVVRVLLTESDECAKMARKAWRVDSTNVTDKTVAAASARVAQEISTIIKRAANQARFERELDEKYGPFKSIVLNPTVQWLAAVTFSAWDNFHVFGNRPLPLVGSIMIAVMMIRAKLPISQIAIAAGLLLAVHPVVLGAIGCACIWLQSSRFKPRQYKPSPPREPLPHTGDALVDEFHDSKLCSEQPYDCIIIGSNMSGLYTAALLSKVGKRVLVLEPQRRIGGTAIVTAADGAHEFETESPAVGNVQRYAKLLSAVAHPAAPPLEWYQVGLSQGGEAMVHTVVQVGAKGGSVLHPTGQSAMINALSAGALDARARVEQFVALVAAAASAGAVDRMCKVFTAATAAKVKRAMSDTFGALACKPCDNFLQKVAGDASSGLYTTLCSMFRAENLAIEDVAMGAFMYDAAHSLDGLHYAKGGWRAVAEALLPTIEAAGGRVLTHVPLKHVLIEDGTAVGVSLSGLDVRCAAGGAVISALGAVETFQTVLAPADLAAYGYPAGYSELREARPRLHVCVNLAGNWGDELAVTACDYVQVRDNEAATVTEHYKDQDSEWFRVSFATAKDPARWWDKSTACVITAELGDEHVKPVYPKQQQPAVAAAAAAVNGTSSSSSSSSTATAAVVSEGRGPITWTECTKSTEKLKDRLLKRLHDAYPATKGADETIDVVIEQRPGLSHTAARYSAEGLRAPTHISGLYLASSDLTTASFAGRLEAGWIAAHSVLGYTPFDMLALKRTLIADLQNVR
jgi:all-trans-retinol 13,14-reductase